MLWLAGPEDDGKAAGRMATVAAVKKPEGGQVGAAASQPALRAGGWLPPCRSAGGGRRCDVPEKERTDAAQRSGK